MVSILNTYLKHIVTSYQKHHSPWNDKIPEDFEVGNDIELFKAQNGIFSNKYSPVIKKTQKTTIKLVLLDIVPNDYLSDIFDEKEQDDEKQLNESISQNLIIYEDKDNKYDDSSFNKKQSLKPAVKNSTDLASELNNSEGKLPINPDETTK